MVSKNHTMILGRSKNKNSRIVGTSFSEKGKKTYLINCYSVKTCGYFV